MAKKTGKNAKKTHAGWRTFFKVMLFILKIPYYIAKGIIHSISFLRKKAREAKINKKRKKMKSVYEDFKVIETEKGNYNKFIESLYNSDNKIGLIIGARGTGKTALGIKFLENAYSKKKRNIHVMGFDEETMPDWISVVSDISQLKNDSFVLIDEGGIFFNAREAMSNSNKFLTELILISRHKNLTILFISQNSSNLEVNVLRQADFLLLKPSSLLQRDFERKIIQKVYDSADKKFDKYKSMQGITYIYSNDFQGFVTNPLPSFWKASISKSFSNNSAGK